MIKFHSSIDLVSGELVFLLRLHCNQYTLWPVVDKGSVRQAHPAVNSKVIYN